MKERFLRTISIIKHFLTKKRQQFCSKSCAAIERGRKGLNERPRQAETGRFSKAVA